MERRRIVPRQPVNWQARYRLETDPDDHWRDCQTVDVTSAGLGLLLRNATKDEAEGKHITIQIELQGEIQHTIPQANTLRVGVRFLGLTDDERSYLDSLASLGTTW